MTERDRTNRRALARDLLVFQAKLALDGLKDIAVFWGSLGAGLIDLVFATSFRTRLFYRVLDASQLFDRTLDLHSPGKRVRG